MQGLGLRVYGSCQSCAPGVQDLKARLCTGKPSSPQNDRLGVQGLGLRACYPKY